MIKNGNVSHNKMGPKNCRTDAVGTLPYLISIKYVSWKGSIPKSAKAINVSISLLLCQILKIDSPVVIRLQHKRRSPATKNLIPTNQIGVTK